MINGFPNQSPDHNHTVSASLSRDSSSMISGDPDDWYDSDLEEVNRKGSKRPIRLANLARASVDANSDNDEYESEEEAFELRGRRESNATDQTFMLYTPDEERSVIHRFDRRLVLFVALLYMLSFLDRSSTLKSTVSMRRADRGQILVTPKSLAFPGICI